MLAFGPLGFFSLEHLQRAYQAVAGVPGKDHIVDIAALGRQKRIGEVRR
jgi:hypothetical protein